MKILFFNPEQYVSFKNEPSNYELRLPILNCGLVSSYRDYVYQRVLRKEGRRAMNKKALQEVIEFSPDLVIYSTSWDDQSIDAYVLQQIINRNVPLYIHVWDTCIKRRFKELEWFLNCNYFGIADSVTNYLYYCSMLNYSKASGVIFTAGHNVYTDFIRKKDMEKKYDVTMLGSNDGRRVMLIQYLKERLTTHEISLHKFGGLVDSTKEVPTEGFRLTGEWVSWEKYVDIINQSRICLVSQTIPERCQVKGKIFDIMACGALCIADSNPEIKRIVPDDCIVYYDDFEDCFRKIIYYLKHEDEQLRIANMGYQWFYKTFDYKNFWSTFLKAVVNGDSELPMLASIETTFEDMQKSRKGYILQLERLCINPVKLSLILRWMPWQLTRLRYCFLITLKKLLGVRCYSILKKIWVNVNKGKEKLVEQD